MPSCLLCLNIIYFFHSSRTLENVSHNITALLVCKKTGLLIYIRVVVSFPQVDWFYNVLLYNGKKEDPHFKFADKSKYKLETHSYSEHLPLRIPCSPPQTVQYNLFQLSFWKFPFFVSCYLDLKFGSNNLNFFFTFHCWDFLHIP